MSSPQGLDEPKTAIDAVDIRKSYASKDKKSDERKTVLEALTFRVSTGTVAAFLGHNGAGKTTLINILSTLLDYDSGNVSIFGTDLARNVGVIRNRIATTGQFAAVDENLTGRENLIFFGRLRGLSRREASVRADELLSEFSLEHVASTLVSAYSGGLRRRLDIAVSLTVVPRLLFLDEPTTGLDPVSREALWSYIRRLKDKGMTLVLTTQYLEEAEALADEVHLLKDHHIVASGTPEQLRCEFGDQLLTIGCATPDDAEVLAKVLETKGIDVEITHGRTVSGVITQGAAFLQELGGLFAESTVTPVSVQIAPPTLNEVFIGLNSEEEKSSEVDTPQMPLGGQQ